MFVSALNQRESRQRHDLAQTHIGDQVLEKLESICLPRS